MNWIEVLKRKQAECEQHGTWRPYWECLHRLEAAKLAFADNEKDCISEKSWRKYRDQAGKIISDKQFAEVEQLAADDKSWTPPKEVEFDENEKLPLSAVLLIPYAGAMVGKRDGFAKRTVILIDSNRALSDANREVLRRVLFKLCDIELKDDEPLLTDAEMFKRMRQEEILHTLEARRHFDEQPEEPHVPKSQRKEFAQTRGPRPQNNNYFSKQGARGRSNNVQRSRGRGR